MPIKSQAIIPLNSQGQERQVSYVFTKSTDQLFSRLVSCTPVFGTFVVAGCRIWAVWAKDILQILNKIMEEILQIYLVNKLTT